MNNADRHTERALTHFTETANRIWGIAKVAGRSLVRIALKRDPHCTVPAQGLSEQQYFGGSAFSDACCRRDFAGRYALVVQRVLLVDLFV